MFRINFILIIIKINIYLKKKYIKIKKICLEEIISNFDCKLYQVTNEKKYIKYLLLLVSV